MAYEVLSHWSLSCTQSEKLMVKVFNPFLLYLNISTQLRALQRDDWLKPEHFPLTNWFISNGKGKNIVFSQKRILAAWVNALISDLEKFI